MFKYWGWGLFLIFFAMTACILFLSCLVNIKILFVISRWSQLFCVNSIILRDDLTQLYIYQSKLVVTCTSEWGCPINNNVSSRIWYIQIVIECNIVIIADIYITSSTSVTLSYCFIFVLARHPVPRKCISKNIFIDYLRVQNSVRAIDALPSAKIHFCETLEHLKS